MDRKKELKAQYKARKVVGGVFRIVNKENGRFFLQSTDDMQAAHNRFRAFQTFPPSGSLPPLQEDWKKYGGEAFEVEELDLLEKKETQTNQEFRQDLKALWEMWDEQLPKENRY